MISPPIRTSANQNFGRRLPGVTASQSGQRPSRSMPASARHTPITPATSITRRIDGGWRAQRAMRSNQVKFIRLFPGESHFADKGQVAVALGKVDAIADDEFVRDFKARPGRLDVDLAPRWLVKQGADVKPARLA